MKKELNKAILSSKDFYHYINIDDILYCRSDHSFTIFYVKNYGQIKVSVSLQEVEKKLKGDDFIRPHHLYLVNLNYIKSITKNHTLEIYLEGGNTIPVSSQMEKKFREEIEKTLNVKII